MSKTKQSPAAASEPGDAVVGRVRGLRTVLARNWEWMGGVSVIIGMVADVLQLLAPVALVAAVIAAVFAVVLTVVRAASAKAARACEAPLLLALFVGVAMGATVAGQAFLGRDDQGEMRGVLASNVKPVANLQDRLKAVVEGLGRVETKLTKVESKIDRILREVSVEKSIPLKTLKSILEGMGASDVALDPDSIRRRLERVGDDFAALNRRLEKLTTVDPAFKKIKAQFDSLVRAGRFDDADRRLAETEGRVLENLKEIEQAVKAKRRAASEARFARGNVAGMRGAYIEAADHYAEASKLAPPGELRARAHFMLAEARALFDQGRTYGDRKALSQAANVCDAVLRLFSREYSPRQWADAQLQKGRALFRLGEHLNNPDALTAAITAYRAALLESPRDKAPLDWAELQNNIGGALIRLADIRKGAGLEDAIAAFELALEERTREAAPLAWAETQSNLAIAHMSIADRDGLHTHYERALEALGAAVEVQSPERSPAAWAGSMVNLASALYRVGKREDGTVRLRASIDASRRVLAVLRRDRQPLTWASAKMNLGLALAMAAGRTRNERDMELAIDAYREAQGTYRQIDRPFNLGSAYVHQSRAEWQLGEWRNDLVRLARARDVLEQAGKIYSAVGKKIMPDGIAAELRRMNGELARREQQASGPAPAGNGTNAPPNTQ